MLQYQQNLNGMKLLIICLMVLHQNPLARLQEIHQTVIHIEGKWKTTMIYLISTGEQNNTKTT